MRTPSGTSSSPSPPARDAARLRIALHFARHASALASHRASSAGATPIGVYWPNIRASFDWAAGEGMADGICDEVWKTLGLGEGLLERADPPTRLRWCDAQLSVARRLGDRRLEAEAKIGLGQLGGGLPGGMPYAETLLREAIEAGEQLAALDIVAHALIARAVLVAEHGITFTSQDTQITAELTDQLAALRERIPARDRILATRILLCFALIRGTQAAYRRQALDAIAQAETILGEHYDDRLEQQLVITKLSVLGTGSDLRECREDARQCLSTSQRLGSHVAQASSLTYLAAISLAQGDVPAAAAYMERVRVLPTRGAHSARLWDVLALSLDGQLAEAWEATAEVARSGLASGYSELRVTAVIGLQRHVLAFLRGDPDTLRMFVSAARRLLPDDSAAAALRAHALAVLGEHAEARAELHRAAARLGEDSLVTGRVHLWALAETAAELHDRPLCIRLYGRLRSESGQILTGALIGMSMGPAERQLCRIARVLGERDAAVDWGKRAVDRDVRMGAAPWACLSRIECARAALDRGGDHDRHDAREHLSRALAAARTMGMRAAIRTGEALSQRLGQER